MFHSRLFSEQAKARDAYIQPVRSGLRSQVPNINEEPWLDGNPKNDRPLIVQFCANDPSVLLEAARYVEPYCDAVDLNLGCPQGIARKGNYGAFLQEDWDLIYRLINNLHNNLSVPVTAKFRILETPEKTLAYAKMIVSAGASIITVHGRRREQKAQNMGVADWSMIRYLRENLPPETVIFANGNILNHGDIERCLEATGADGVMSAEGNLSDPTIFAEPPAPTEGEREYWRGRNGQGGYRIDAVTRRYFDIVYREILEQEPPQRPPLFIPSDGEAYETYETAQHDEAQDVTRKGRKQEKRQRTASPNTRVMQAHLFQLFRPFVGTYTHIRDALARSNAGDMASFERVLSLLEKQVKQALLEEASSDSNTSEDNAVARPDRNLELTQNEQDSNSPTESEQTIAQYRRPWFVCQPYIRPLPEEAIKNGSLQVSKKELAKLTAGDATKQSKDHSPKPPSKPILEATATEGRFSESTKAEIPEEAAVCG